MDIQKGFFLNYAGEREVTLFSHHTKIITVDNFMRYMH